MNPLLQKDAALSKRLFGLAIKIFFLCTLVARVKVANAQNIVVAGPVPCNSSATFGAICASLDGSTYPATSNVNTGFSAILLAQISQKLDSMSQSLQRNDQAIAALLAANKSTNDAIQKQGDTFNNVILATVSDRFQQLPTELRDSDALKQLKTDILAIVDQKIAALRQSSTSAPVAANATVLNKKLSTKLYVHHQVAHLSTPRKVFVAATQ